ncbi:MAG: hypothetical protein V4721_10190 [Bacteroidota bacterium]
MPISFTQPSEVQVATSSNWIASNSAFDMRKIVMDQREAKVWGSQDITGLFDKLAGGKNYVANNFGRHIEEDRLHAVIHATGTTQAALGAVVYTLVAADTITSYPGVYDPYIAAGTTSTLVPVRVHETLVFPGDIRGKVTAVSTNTFTVTPTGSADLPTTISTDEIWSLGLSVYEGFEGDLTSNNWRENIVKWKSEIMVDMNKSTGTAMVQETWVSFTDPNSGKTMHSWWFKGQQNAFKQFNNYREMKWVLGEAVTNATTLATNYNAQYSQVSGLIPFAESFGNTPTYDLTTGMTLDDFQTIVIDNLNKNAGATENSLFESISFKKVIDSFIRIENMAGGIEYAAFNGKEDQYVNFGFKSFKVLDYTFHNKVYELFNNPTLAGAIGSRYRDFGFWVPMENNMYKVDGQTEKVDCPPMRVNYLKLGDNNREWRERLTGGAINAYTNAKDVAQIDFLSENSPQFFGSNRFGTIEGVNL